MGNLGGGRSAGKLIAPARGCRGDRGRIVSRVLFPVARRWSSLWDGRRRPPRAAYPRLGRCGPHLAAYLALLRLGVAVPRPLPVPRWALTPPFHPYRPVAREAVCFLWPCPSPRGAQALPGSLPCGARTFLERLPARDHRVRPRMKAIATSDN